MSSKVEAICHISDTSSCTYKIYLLTSWESMYFHFIYSDEYEKHEVFLQTLDFTNSFQKYSLMFIAVLCKLWGYFSIKYLHLVMFQCWHLKSHNGKVYIFPEIIEKYNTSGNGLVLSTEYGLSKVIQNLYLIMELIK